MGTRNKVINDCGRGDSASIRVRTNPDQYMVTIASDNCVQLDAAGVGQLVGALTQWLADRADRL